MGHKLRYIVCVHKGWENCHLTQQAFRHKANTLFWLFFYSAGNHMQ